jgi:hypothetical protein
MIGHSEKPRAERLPVPIGLSDRGLADRPVRLVNLSLGGACIEHLQPLPAWGTCFVGLAPALGGIHLEGQVVWSRPAGQQPDTQGQPQVFYRRGLRFAWLTAEQQAGLAAALEILEAAAAPVPPAGAAQEAHGETARSGQPKRPPLLQ